MQETSPAEDAGLISDFDFVFHCITFPYESFDEFCEAVDKHCQATEDGKVKSIKLAVYNIRDDEVRVVSINPSRDWNDQGGWLGCGFGDGLIDNLRSIQESLLSKEISKIESTENLVSPSKSESSANSNSTPGRRRAQQPVTPDMDAFMNKRRMYHNVESNPVLPGKSLTADRSQQITISGSLMTAQGLRFCNQSTGLRYNISTGDLIHVEVNFSQAGNRPAIS